MNIPNRRETLILAAVFAFANCAGAVYSAFRVRPSAGFLLIYYVAVAWAFAAWTIADAKRTSCALSLDFGWFVFLAWPLVVPYHLIRTRGIKSLVTLVAFAAMFIAAYLTSLVVFFALVALQK